MLGTKCRSMLRRMVAPHQTGVVAVELALVLGLYLTMIFGIIEIARIMYIYNTVQEVTRRAANAAATHDFSDATWANSIRYDAVFRSSPGELVIGNPVTDQNVRIEYLNLIRQSNGTLSMNPIALGSFPSSPAKNREICMADPNAPNCIRFVRASVCDTANADQCDRLNYQSFTQFVNLPVKLPTAQTIVPAQSLGFALGAVPGP